MKRKLKTGVRALGVHPEMLIADRIVEGVYEDAGAIELVITSITDGSRKRLRDTLHVGFAIDYRRWHIDAIDWPLAMTRLRHRLGPDFDAVLEDDHLHVEYDPK